MSIKDITNNIYKPIRKETAFWSIFFILISVPTIKHLIAEFINFNGSWILYEHTMAAMGLSYICTLIVYFSKKKTIKLLFYSFGLLIFGITIFLWQTFGIQPNDPMTIQLLFETNSNESAEFIRTFILSKGSLITLCSVITFIAIIYLLEKYQKILSTSKNSNHNFILTLHYVL